MVNGRQPARSVAAKITKRSGKKIRRIVGHKKFTTWYLRVSLFVLGTTTIYWSLLGGIVQSTNADQTVNVFLLDTHGALLPSNHTFLIKIPLFWLVSLFGNEPAGFIIATTVLSLLTVAGLAYILWRIENRPVVLATILIALSATLLYIPAQSYPGSLLPANFAMLTTRNIEYLVYIGAIILTIRSGRFMKRFTIAAMVAFALLFASDRLFIVLALGASVISGVAFWLTKRRDLLDVALRLIVTVIVGIIGAFGIIMVLKLTGLQFDSSAAPYSFASGPKAVAIGLIYALMGTLTNLGANPAFSTLIVTDLPLGIIKGLVAPAGPGYVITIGITVFIIRATYRSIRTLLKRRSARRPTPIHWQTILPFVLVAAFATSLITYVATNHYYPADSRYLAVVLPAGFIALAAASRAARPKTIALVRYSALCLVAVIFGIVFQLLNLTAQNKTTAEITRRNAIVATALKSHPVGTLVGDYWRVLPIKLGSPTIAVTPLQDCTTPRQVLSSTAWQPDLHKTSFAYLLRLDGALADSPDCTLKQITGTYGRPDSSVVIAGTRAQPKELLLFYDDGIHFLKAQAPNNTPSDTVTAIPLASMPYTTCPGPSTVMQVVAHEDDDLLFMNPDLTHAVRAGDCVRTVYVTAGDAGSNRLYWIGRQHGAEAAYNTILATPGRAWTERVVALDATHTATVANPRGNHSVSLIFLHLPDGSPTGAGFPSNRYESLQKLYAHVIPAVHPVDDPSVSYTSGDVSSALTNLMAIYKPSAVRTQSTYDGADIKDHSDHNAVGEFATSAFKAYSQSAPDASLTYYLGYPVHALPANVSDADYDQKAAAFLAFSQFDGATCHSIAACNAGSVYGIYLARQYTYPY